MLFLICDFIFSQELHLYEGYISSSSRSVTEKVANLFFHNEHKDICKGWETSAHALLDRVFQKWGSFNNEDNETLTEHLRSYKEGFHSVTRQFPVNLFPSQINVGVSFLFPFSKDYPKRVDYRSALFVLGLWADF